MSNKPTQTPYRIEKPPSKLRVMWGLVRNRSLEEGMKDLRGILQEAVDHGAIWNSIKIQQSEDFEGYTLTAFWLKNIE